MADLNLAFGPLLFEGPEAMKLLYEVLKQVGIKEIDTAEMYGDGRNEKDLGDSDVASTGLVVSTKNYGGWKKGYSLKPENMRKTTKASLERLHLDQVDIFYIHGPDRSMKLDDWVPTVQELYGEGAFRRFGVSNFSSEEVRELYDYCKSKGYVLPTVYQGNYHAMSRAFDTTLFPVLRELGMSFYAYSALGGGFLTKSRKAIEEDTEGGRFATGGSALNEMYRGMYMRPSLLSALDQFEALAAQEGVPKAELAYRWVYYHSSLKPQLGDKIVVGASKLEQIVSTVAGLKKGPLKPETAKGIDAMWDSVKDEAVLDNFHETQSGK